MRDDTRRVVEAVEAAAVGSSEADRVELIEAVLYAVYDHMKFRVPGGADSEERDDLGRLLSTVIGYADRTRSQGVRLPDTRAQELVDHVLDRVCQERPSSSWVITAPLEVVAMLPPDEGWVARRVPGHPEQTSHTRSYRGADVEVSQLDRPLVVFTDIATDTPAVYLNLDTGEVGNSSATIGLG